MSRAAGLEDRVTLLHQDYRELEGQFDKLVSIEMIEAVGWQYFDTFFERCAALLKPQGAMLLQAITIDQRAYHVEKYRRSFANTQVFPGGCLPSLAAISRSVARVTDMRPVHLEDITTHYVRTLRCWRENFLDPARARASARLRQPLPADVGALPRLLRGGFDGGRIGDVQLLLGKPRVSRGARRDATGRVLTAGPAPPKPRLRLLVT